MPIFGTEFPRDSQSRMIRLVHDSCHQNGNPTAPDVSLKTEVEYLPQLPLNDDELEKSEYWIAAPRAESEEVRAVRSDWLQSDVYFQRELGGSGFFPLPL